MDNTYMYTNKSSKPRLLTLVSLLLVESIMMKHHTDICTTCIHHTCGIKTRGRVAPSTTNDIEPLTHSTNSAVYTISSICTTYITINVLTCACSNSST